jgi:hypothetical protein
VSINFTKFLVLVKLRGKMEMSAIAAQPATWKAMLPSRTKSRPRRKLSRTAALGCIYTGSGDALQDIRVKRRPGRLAGISQREFPHRYAQGSREVEFLIILDFPTGCFQEPVYLLVGLFFGFNREVPTRDFLHKISWKSKEYTKTIWGACCYKLSLEIWRIFRGNYIKWGRAGVPPENAL